MQEKNVISELDMTKSQEEKIKRLIREYRTNVILRPVSRERFLQMLDGKQDSSPEDFRKVLLKHQLEVLRQLELQILVSNFWSNYGLLHDEVSKKLQVTKEQKEEIFLRSKEFEKETEALLKKASADVLQHINDSQPSIFKLLTKKQRKKYDRYFGKPALALFGHFLNYYERN